MTTAGVEAGVHVLLHVHAGGEELATLVVKHCYKLGAGFVDKILFDQRDLFEQLRHCSDSEQIPFSQSEFTAWDQAIEKNGCVIQIRADMNPSLVEEVSTLYCHWRNKVWDYRAGFKTIAMDQNKIARTLIYVPTVEAASRVFPELPRDDALSAYWNSVFEKTLTADPNWRSLLKTSNQKLHRRCKFLNSLEIERLQLFGQNTELQIGLTPVSRWLGGPRPGCNQICLSQIMRLR